MKKERFVAFALMVTLVGLSAFIFIQPPSGTIKGTVIPADSALRAWAILPQKDTIKANVIGGKFVLTNLRAGRYNLLIEPVPPGRDVMLKDVEVFDGKTTDVGEIYLNKKRTPANNDF